MQELAKLIVVLYDLVGTGVIQIMNQINKLILWKMWVYSYQKFVTTG
jgi:hypothetical protein